MLALLIDVHKGRDMPIADVVLAHLIVSMDKYVLVKLKCDVVDIMCQINKVTYHVY